ncbi:putative formylmethanofuran dehydrogenase, subunit A [Rosa chinensis]|uniref:Putative formylmethanofuran dehydrogenase, subunit A n=1 Tax=Rosa chinensis TaxID=74649 RepID=A0A2P6PLP3_ROSCH|nr:putative formylmethanofuran dehydrogenase, subunit A [Rosa chinensis]
MVGYGTKELDLKGKIVVPGFIDSHVHLIFGGLQMMRVELHGINSKDEFVKRIKEAVRRVFTDRAYSADASTRCAGMVSLMPLLLVLFLLLFENH